MLGIYFYFLIWNIAMKKALLASLIASTVLLTACGGEKHDKVYAEEMVKTAEENAKKLAPEAEKITFGDEGAPKAGEATAQADTATEQSGEKADEAKTDEQKSDEAKADEPKAEDKKADDSKSEADAPKADDKKPADTAEAKTEDKKDGQ